MTEENKTKTFVRGSFLYLDEAGAYQEQQNTLDTKEKVVEDKIGIYKYQKEMKQKVAEANNRKRQNQGNKNVQKPVLIPIRDTPVEPIPQPVLENQKCQRAMQQQFDYFQTYVSQKEKEKQFEEQEEKQINDFLLKQQKLKQSKIENPPIETTQIVMEKEIDSKSNNKTKKIIKVKVKSKDNQVK